MKNILRTARTWLLAMAALLSPLAAIADVPWIIVEKDSGMAQYKNQIAYVDGVGHLILYVGSENFSAAGSGKVNVFKGIIESSFRTPTNDGSVDVMQVLTLFLGGQIPQGSVAVGTDSAHVYFFDGNGNWTNVTPTATAFSTNLGVYAIAQYAQRLFIGTGGSAGSAQIWAYDGAAWTQQSLPGFPSDNYYAWVMTVFNNALYVGTVDYSRAAQVWKYDGSTWSQVSIPSFGSNNYAIASMAVFNGKLYIGTSNTLGGAEIWSYDGSTWTKLSGFGKNDAVTTMAVYNGALYIGTTNYTQGVSAQLWGYDGNKLAQVSLPAAFTSAGNSGIVSMTAAGDALSVGTYNNSGAELWSVTGNLLSAPAANLPGALSGLWWNANESGWGIDFTQRGSNIFAAWYTYDASGNPKWYVASACAGAGATSGTCSGALYQVTGPAFFGTTFNPLLVNVTQAGNLSVTFQDANNASMTYTVAGQTRTVPITRQPVGAGTATLSTDYTDLWWNASESGWGMAMAQQQGNIFVAWYVYQSNGQPVWYVASNCTISGSGCSGTLYATTGPAFGATFDPNQVHVTSVGTVSVSFSDPNNAVLTYTVNGVSGTKNITRQLF
jgi:hypothetical protein